MKAAFAFALPSLYLRLRANNQRCHYGGSSKALPTISAGRGSNHIPFPLGTSGRDKPHQSHTGIRQRG